MNDSNKLVVLCVAYSDVGHVNSTIGLASVLKGRGHTVVFAAERSWAGKLTAYGFEEELYDEKDVNEESDDERNKIMAQRSRVPLLETIDQLEHILPSVQRMFLTYKYSNKRIAEIIDQRKPDIIIQEGYYAYPAIARANIPVVFLHSANPLKVLEDVNSPPADSGYGLEEDQERWKAYRQRFNEQFKHRWNEMSNWIVSQGAPSLQYPRTQYTSTSLNLYLYPASLAALYRKRRTSPSPWTGIDHCVGPVHEKFVVPEKLERLPGKLVYVSLGSINSAVVHLMRQIVGALSKSEHKFIVCLGRNYREYSLADNMWGEPFLPQKAVLPHVDLVITHGGNNSFVESLYFGKPMIVMPLVCDQYDNAQMAEEAKIGLKFRFGREPMENLVKKVDMVLNDKQILANVEKLSEELQKSDSLNEAACKLEAAARNPRIPTIIEAAT